MAQWQSALENLVIEQSFWQDRRVFLTGHTGFKGTWLSIWLKHLGAKVTGYALKAPTEPAFFEDCKVDTALQQSIVGDIRHLETLTAAMQQAKPEIVIHMAAQSLVRESYTDPVSTYATNVMGTVNVLEAVRNTPSVKAILNITTDKCYENNEWPWGYRENDAIGGHDPYSNSKGCAELVSSAYRNSFFKAAGIGLATARAGNVIGGGDWANDRIVPDAIRAFVGEQPLMVRNPMATRPWQHVLEPLCGYIMLCQQLVNAPEQFAQGWNFGPGEQCVQPVSKLADIMVENWGGEAGWRLHDGAHPHEAQSLKLDCSKAQLKLKWHPVWALERTINETVQWYQAWNTGEDMYTFSLQQIKTYQQEHLGQ